MLREGRLLMGSRALGLHISVRCPGFRRNRNRRWLTEVSVGVFGPPEFTALRAGRSAQVQSAAVGIRSHISQQPRTTGNPHAPGSASLTYMPVASGSSQITCIGQSIALAAKLGLCANPPQQLGHGLTHARRSIVDRNPPKGFLGRPKLRSKTSPPKFRTETTCATLRSTAPISSGQAWWL